MHFVHRKLSKSWTILYHHWPFRQLRHLDHIHGARHVLNWNNGVDWDAKDVVNRIATLLVFDRKHKGELSLSHNQFNQLKILRDSNTDPAKRSAEFIFSQYFKSFCMAYGITHDDLGISGRHYLEQLDIDLMPIPEDQKFGLVLLTNMI